MHFSCLVCACTCACTCTCTCVLCCLCKRAAILCHLSARFCYLSVTDFVCCCSTAGYRWHLNCFRCDTCDTLLDSNTILLLMGDGSLICNNCTYSCNACGNKIEDLAILTGDQAFCATCFRCRNCKRKIENLRYARTSTGIFCMSCHESLTARKKKRAKAAQAAKARDKEIANSPMITEKSLPALPPTFESRHDHDHHHDHDHDHDHGHGHGHGHDTDPATELSPRPRQHYGGVGDSFGSPDRSNESPGGHKNDILLPPVQYRNNNRASTIGPGDGVDLDSFFMPMALEETPARPTTSSAPAPHIFFQEKGRLPSVTSEPLVPDGTPRAENTRKMSKSGRNDSRTSYLEDLAHQSPSSRTSPDEFKLQEAPKSKKTSSPISQSADSGFGGVTKSSSSSSRTSYYAASNTNGTPKAPQLDSQTDYMSKSIARKEVGSNAPNSRSASSKFSCCFALTSSLCFLLVQINHCHYKKGGDNASEIYTHCMTYVLVSCQDSFTAATPMKETAKKAPLDFLASRNNLYPGPLLFCSTYYCKTPPSF